MLATIFWKDNLSGSLSFPYLFNSHFQEIVAQPQDFRVSATSLYLDAGSCEAKKKRSSQLLKRRPEHAVLQPFYGYWLRVQPKKYRFSRQPCQEAINAKKIFREITFYNLVSARLVSFELLNANALWFGIKTGQLTSDAKPSFQAWHLEWHQLTGFQRARAESGSLSCVYVYWHCLSWDDSRSKVQATLDNCIPSLSYSSHVTILCDSFFLLIAINCLSVTMAKGVLRNWASNKLSVSPLHSMACHGSWLSGLLPWGWCFCLEPCFTLCVLADLLHSLYSTLA